MNTANLARLAPAAAAAAVAISAGIALAPVTWHAMGMTGGGQPAPRMDAAIGGPDDAPGPSVTAIQAMAPFGRYLPVEDAAPRTIRETELGLVLRGVLVAGRPHESAAFIAHGSAVNSFAIGDTVIRGAVLTSVHNDYVELAVGGGIETLSFPDAGTETRRQAGVDSMRARLSSSARGSAASAPATSAASSTSPSPEEVIEDYRQRIAANPQTVLDGLGLEAGEQGYRIRDDAPAMVRRAGLRAGDVVMRVNGEPVGDVESDRRLYDRVAASGQARVEIMRDGRVVVLSFPLY